MPSRTDVETFTNSWGIRRWSLSPRGSLTAFALFVCTAIVAVFAAGTLHARNVATTVAGVSARNLAASISEQTSDTFEAIDGAMLTLSDRIETDGTAPATRIRLRDDMAGLVRAMPRIHAIDVVDDHGHFVVSNLSATSNFNPLAVDRPYFRYHRSHPGSNLYISGPARSKVDGVPVLFATRRLEHADGSFAGVLIVPISLAYFEQMFASVDVGKSGAISLFSDDAVVMARKPRAKIGNRVSGVKVFADPYKYEVAGTYFARSRVDGVQRLFAFARLGRYPLVVDVSLAESEYLNDWRSGTLSAGFAVAGLIVMIGGLAAGLGAQIDRRRVAEENLARLALLDGLTGLANRRQFDAELEREWRSVSRDRAPLALLMIDVDHFKAYNDRYGHQSGDEVLGRIARTIDANIVRPRDLAARYGGEEFAVILPGNDLAGAVVVAERIRRAIVALNVPNFANGATSVSIGAASVPPASFAGRAGLIQAADDALYAAKRAGRNRTSTCAEPQCATVKPETGPIVAH